MAVFDIRSNLRVLLSFDDVITVNGVLNSLIVDTSDGELGYMLAIYAEQTSGNPIDGDYAISFEQSDTGAFAGEETVVPQQNLIGDNIFFDSSSVDFETKSQGVFSNLKFLRAVATTTNIGPNGVTLVGIVVQGVEHKPDVDDVVGN